MDSLNWHVPRETYSLGQMAEQIAKACPLDFLNQPYLIDTADLPNNLRYSSKNLGSASPTYYSMLKTPLQLGDPAACILLNLKLISTLFAPGFYDWEFVLRVAIHELAHCLSQPNFMGDSPVRFSPAGTESYFRLQADRDAPTNVFETPDFNGGHDIDFVRAVCHLTYRLEPVFGIRLPRNQIFESIRYGLSLMAAYEFAFDDECRSQTHRPIREILTGPLPPKAQSLWDFDRESIARQNRQFDSVRSMSPREVESSYMDLLNNGADSDERYELLLAITLQTKFDAERWNNDVSQLGKRDKG